MGQLLTDQSPPGLCSLSAGGLSRAMTRWSRGAPRCAHDRSALLAPIAQSARPASGPKMFRRRPAGRMRWRLDGEQNGMQSHGHHRSSPVSGDERKYVRRDKPYLRRLVRRYCDQSAAVGKMSDQDGASAEHPGLWKKRPLLPINHKCHAEDGVQRRVRRLRCADGGHWRRPGAGTKHGAPKARATAEMLPRRTAAPADIPPGSCSHVSFPQPVKGPSPRVWLTRRRDTRRARGPSAARREPNSVSGTGKAGSCPRGAGCPRRARERHATAYRTPSPVRGNSQGAYFAIDRTES